MQMPFSPPDEKHDMICPNCGSTNVSLDETNEVKNTHNEKLKQFICSDCRASFIPSITESTEHSQIKHWAVKNRTNEGMNEGKAWSKPKQEFIIIIPKDNK